MNISPIMLNNYLAIKKQNIKNYQTRPNFKSLNFDTVSFSGETGLNFAERMAFKTKYQKLAEMLDNPSLYTAQKCIESLKQLKDDKDCPADLKSEILLGEDKQAMNKVIKLYMDTRYADEKTSLFDLIEAMISASPNKETTLAQFTTVDEDERIPIQVGCNEKEVVERILECFQNNSEALFAQCDALDKARFETRYISAMKIYGRLDKEEAICYGCDEDIIAFFEDLIEPKQNEDEPTIIRNQEIRDEIINNIREYNAIGKRLASMDYETEEATTEEKIHILDVLVALMTPEEKKELLLDDKCLGKLKGYIGFKYLLDSFKGDTKAIDKIYSKTPNKVFGKLSDEQCLKLLEDASSKNKKKLLLTKNGLVLDLLPISYADKSTQMKFLKASPDYETLERQILALPILTEEALELVPEEKREEIETEHKEKRQKRKNSLYKTPNTIYNIINNASESNRSKVILEIAGILADDHNQLRRFLFNRVNFNHSGFVVFDYGQYVPGSPINTLNENHKCKILDLVLPDEDLFFEIFGKVDFEVLKKQAYKYCQKAPSDEAILKILKHEKKKVSLTRMQDRLEYTCLAGNLTPEQTLDVFGLLKDKNSKIKFLLLEYENCEHKLGSVWGVGSRGKGVVGSYTTSSMGFTRFHDIYIKETGTEYRTQSTKEVFEKLISQDSSYFERVTDIILNLALDKEVADEEVEKLLSTYLPMLINGDNALEFFSKILEIVNSNNDKEQIRRLLENIKANVPEIYKKEIDNLIEELN